MKVKRIVVAPGQRKERLDKYLSNQLENCSRTLIQRMLNNGLVFVNNKKEAQASYRVKPTDIIEVHFPFRKEVQIEPEQIPLEVIYEDEHLLVVNKQKGLVVHPAPGNWTGTLVNAVLGYYQEKGEWEEFIKQGDFDSQFRLGLVHRLDKNTSGVILLAKDNETKKELSNLFKKRKIAKEYRAIIWGKLKPAKGIIKAPLGRNSRDRKKMAVVSPRKGKWGITRYQVLNYLEEGKYTDLSLLPKTGRTHQLRVHLKSIGHPILGDAVYGKNTSEDQNINLCLHAYSIKFSLKQTGKSYSFTAPLPLSFKQLIKN